ncbi:MAG: ATP-dependent nuclease [Brevinema sp.]
MYLKEIKNIKNYRNLDNINLQFSSKTTYIVGENNLGKTNISNMLKKIFNAGDFDLDDFANSEIPISFECMFQTENSEETGFFKDAGFDPNIPVIGEQFFDERAGYSCNNIPVHNELRRRICFISVPSDIKDEKIPNLLPSGKYSAIQYIYKKIEEITRDVPSDILNESSIQSIKEKLICHIQSLPFFNDLSINHFVEIEKLVGSILFLQENSGQPIDNSGSGLRRRLYIVLRIINALSLFLENNKNHINSLITNEKRLPVIVCLDEPELHAHPHWQRQLISELQNILEQTFENIKTSCQLIIITHSPYMIAADTEYTLNRLFRNQNIVKSSQISSNFNQEVHDRFIEQIREAYYSKGVLLVEGESEIGMLAAYNKYTPILTKKSISVISLDGAKSFSSLCQFFQELQIPVWGIIDSDLKNEISLSNITYSDKWHLEESIYESLKAKNLFTQCITSVKIDLNLKKAYKQMKCSYRQQSLPFTKDNFQQYRQNDKDKIFNQEYSTLVTDEDKDFHKILWLASLSNHKSAYEGKKLGEFLINNSCFPEYMVEGIEKLVGEVK